MTAAASKPAARFDVARRVAPLLLVVGAIGLTAWLQPRAIDYIAHAGWRLKVPELGLIAQREPMLQLHLFAALTALAIGIVLMLRPKGVGLHKALGWTWVLAMAATATSSLFLSSFTGGRFGFIHLLSGWTIIALPMAVAAIRRRDVAGHRRAMTGLFTGGLLVAGALTFIPGRLMWRVFFG
jgi:uncharacterized membrane protein